MSRINLSHLTLGFGQTRAIDNVSTEIGAGRFLALLGPSGCGKTTLLRLIAGLARPDQGTIRIGDQLMAGPGQFVGPERRGLGMVFQSYALWPHMTVAANIGFGLNHLTRADRRARIDAALATTGMSAMADRKPHELSGGQRQRVALARSLASRPQVLLLDEPLANLDAHLRQSMLAEFRRIHAELGCTIVFVTHDQNEAMAVADLVGVMDRGRIEQIDAPRVLFQRPATAFVARFIGQGSTLPVTVTASGSGMCEIAAGSARLKLPGAAPPGPGWLCLHPRDLEPASGGLVATVVGARFQDGDDLAEITFDQIAHDSPIPVRLPRPANRGETLHIAIRGGWVLPRTGTGTGTDMPFMAAKEPA